jgi:hypothetical protein
MTSSEAKDRLSEFISATTGGLDAIRPPDMIKLMAVFYRDERASDCDFSDDGDMLLFEWGVYSWGGEAFRVKIIRQFIPRGGDDDDVFQLALAVHYPPDEEARSAATTAIASRKSNRWCSSPDELSEFLDFVLSSPALALAACRVPFKITLEYHRAA